MRGLNGQEPGDGEVEAGGQRVPGEAWESLEKTELIIVFKSAKNYQWTAKG